MSRARVEQVSRQATAGRGRLSAALWARAVAVAAVGLAVAPVGAWAGSLFGPPPVPDWVHDAVKQPLPEIPKSAKAVMLLEDTTYTVDEKGQAVEHVRRVVKILRPQGREYGYPFVRFDKDSKVLSMHVWSIDPAGHEYSVKDNEIFEVGSPGEAGILYDDQRAKVADPPGRDPGGIVAYEFERRERPYLAETNWEFQDEIPRVRQSFTLNLPPGFTYSTTWANHEKVAAGDSENHGYRWEMRNVAAVNLENVPMSPSPEALVGRMTVHYTGPGVASPQDGTWEGVGEWFDWLAHERTQPTPEITAKAQELTAGKTDFYEKAQALGEFVQKQIRYYAVELGVGGDQPHYAADIFKGRYGDCKDKSTLLAAMMSSVGLHSDLVLVDTRRGVINRDNPSAWGDHAIAAIEIPAGYQSAKMHSVVTAQSGKRYLIFDPTWEKTPFGKVEDNLQGSYAVLVEGKRSELIQIPVLAPELNTIQRHAKLVLAADGSLSGEFTDRRAGDVASYRRRELEEKDGKKQQELIDRIVARDVAAATLSGLKFENVTALDQELTTSFDLKAMHFASATGPLLMVRPRVLGSYTPDVDRKDRKVSVDLERTMQGTDTYDIELPEGYAVDELPDPVKVDFGFASYESKTEVVGRTMHYSRTYTVKQVMLPPSKYEDLQKLASIIAADEDSRAVLKKAK